VRRVGLAVRSEVFTYAVDERENFGVFGVFGVLGVDGKLK